jgi:hypothetical protein
MSRNIVAATLIGIALLARASAAADTSTKAVEQFLDEQIAGVIRVDTGRVDMKALEAWIAETLQADDAKADAAKPAKAGDVVETLREPLAEIGKYLGEFRAAGGREMYVLLSTADLMAGPPPVLIPLAQGADAKRLEALFGPPGPAPEQAASARVGDVLIVAVPAARQRLRETHDDKARKPANPDLLAALGAAGGDGAAVRFVFAPTPDARRAFEQLAPTLPPQLGGGPTADITHGMRWAALSLKLPPQPSVGLVIQSPDAAAAQALDKTLRAALGASAESLKAEAAKAGEHAQTPMFRALVKLLPALTPKREGDRLVVSLDDARLREAGTLLSTTLVRARTQAQQVQSISQMKQLVLACHMWANEHKREWPDDLAAAAKAYDVPKQMLVNPARPKSGYTYLKPPKDAKDGGTRIVLYEAEGAPEGRAAGFLDGHVEFMTEQEFQKALKAQQKADKPGAGKE